jgi:hypothetical protein
MADETNIKDMVRQRYGRLAAEEGGCGSGEHRRSPDHS